MQCSAAVCIDVAGDGRKMSEGAKCGIAEVPGPVCRAAILCPVLARTETIELDGSAVRVFVNLDVTSPGLLKSFLRKAEALLVERHDDSFPWCVRETVFKGGVGGTGGCLRCAAPDPRGGRESFLPAGTWHRAQEAQAKAEAAQLPQPSSPCHNSIVRGTVCASVPGLVA